MRLSRGEKNQRFANISLDKKVECQPSISNICAAAGVILNLKGFFSSVMQALLSLPIGVTELGDEE